MVRSVGATLSRPVVWAAVAIMLGAVALALLPSIPDRFGLGMLGSQPTASEPIMPPQGSASGLVTEVLAPAEPAAESASEAGAAAASAPETEAPAPLAAASASDGASGLITFTTKGDSWVTVRDARGVVLINRGLSAGESVGVSGDVPLSVTVGRVDMTSVTVRGKPLDLKSISRTNVARFKVE